MNSFNFFDKMYTDFWQPPPSEVKGVWNFNTQFQSRYLWTQVYSLFDFTLPKEWDMNFFRFLLFRWGSAAVIYTKEFGWIVQGYGVQKLNLYYNPAVIIVTNRYLDMSKIGVIGVNAEIIKIMDDYQPLVDLVTHYAERLAQVDRDIEVNLMTANVSLTYPAENKNEADSVYEAYAQATTGKPFVPIRKDLGAKPISPLIAGVKQNYIVNDLLAARRSIVSEFLTKIGVPNVSYEKKERLVTGEVEQNEDETKTIYDVILGNIKESFDKVNAISGLGIKVMEHFQREEVDGNGKDNAMGDVPVR